MSIESEIAALRQLLGSADDESLLVTVYGNVNAPGINQREGIFFATNKRFGLSVEAGLFEGAAYFILDYSRLFNASVNDRTLSVDTVPERSILSIKAYDYEESLEPARATLHRLAAQHVRTDLLNQAGELSAALERDDYPAVERSAQNVLRFQPECLFALYCYSIAQRARADRAGAVSSLERMLEIGPVDPLGLCEELAELHIELNQVEIAEDLLAEVLEEAQCATAFVLRSRARGIRGDIAGSLADAKRAVDLDSASLNGWHLLAMHAIDLLDTSELERAVQAFERLKADELAVEYRARLCLLLDDPQAAFKAAEVGLKKFPSHLALALTMLEASLEISEEMALACVKRFDSLHQSEPEYLFWSSFALLTGGSATEALARFRSIPREGEDSFDASLIAVLEAASLLESGSSEKALDTVERAIEAGRGAPSTGFRETLRAILHYLGGKASLNLSRYEKAHLHLTEVEPQLNEHESALRWVRKGFSELLDQASRGAARRSYEGIAPTGMGRAGAFEALRLLAEALEASQRHRDLALRVRDDLARFDDPPLIAVMGEYSVGKSSFINSLVQRPGLLPTGDGVTTGTITVLRYGEQERMRAVFKSGRVVESDSLQPVDRFVREADGEERKGLHHVDVFVKSEVLRRASVVDSPGLNAPFPEHRAITEAFLEEADAICFLFNVENTGKSDEAAFLDKLRQHSRKAVGVVNQIDLVSAADAQEVVEAVSTDFPGVFATVLGVSARRALQGIERHDDGAYAKSGMPSLVSWLETNLLGAARQIKVDAVRARAQGVVREVRDAHVIFDRDIDALLKKLQDRRAALLRWTSDDLRTLLHEELAKVRDTLGGEISKVAEATAANSEPSRAPRGIFFDQWGRRLIDATKTSRTSLLEALHAQHDAQLQSVRSYFEEIRTSQWHEPMREGIRAFLLECASWRKDLADYLEQPLSFLEGFVEARGLATIVYTDVPDSSYHRADLVRAALTPRLAFLHERVGLAATRWASELRANYDSAFTGLDRQLRAEATRVREQSFRRVEALEVLFSDPPGGVAGADRLPS
jgi:tetratricopeptide (TPR) repeat protein